MFDLTGQTGSIVQSAAAIHSFNRDIPLTLDVAIVVYNTVDRTLASKKFEKAIGGKFSFAFISRFMRPDGEFHHAFPRFEIDGQANSSRLDLFGSIQKTTAQVAHEAALKVARVRTEETATHATIMAEIDQLTGIGNRRGISRSNKRSVHCRKVESWCRLRRSTSTISSGSMTLTAATYLG